MKFASFFIIFGAIFASSQAACLQGALQNCNNFDITLTQTVSGTTTCFNFDLVYHGNISLLLSKVVLGLPCTCSSFLNQQALLSTLEGLITSVEPSAIDLLSIGYDAVTGVTGIILDVSNLLSGLVADVNLDLHIPLNICLSGVSIPVSLGYVGLSSDGWHCNNLLVQVPEICLLLGILWAKLKKKK